MERARFLGAYLDFDRQVSTKVGLSYLIFLDVEGSITLNSCSWLKIRMETSCRFGDVLGDANSENKLTRIVIGSPIKLIINN